jgi:hypothetical protein
MPLAFVSLSVSCRLPAADMAPEWVMVGSFAADVGCLGPDEAMTLIQKKKSLRSQFKTSIGQPIA